PLVIRAVADLVLVRPMKPHLFLVTVLCLAADAGSLPESLLDKNVTFKLPAHWIAQRQFTKGSAKVLQLLIPDPDTDEMPDSSNAIITAEPLQAGVTVERFGDSRLRSYNSSLSSFTVLTDVPAGQSWRTVLSRVQQGNIPYVVFDRFGVDAGYMVALRIAFPI